MSEPLTQEAIDKMTKGLKQKAAKVRYLRKIGIRAERKPDGSVLVMPEWLAGKAAVVAESQRKPMRTSQREREQAQKT